MISDDINEKVSPILIETKNNNNNINYNNINYNNINYNNINYLNTENHIIKIDIDKKELEIKLLNYFNFSSLFCLIYYIIIIIITSFFLFLSIFIIHDKTYKILGIVFSGLLLFIEIILFLNLTFINEYQINFIFDIRRNSLIRIGKKYFTCNNVGFYSLLNCKKFEFISNEIFIYSLSNIKISILNIKNLEFGEKDIFYFFKNNFDEYKKIKI